MARDDIIKGFVLGVAAAAAVPLLLGSSRGQALGRAAMRAGERFAEKARELAAEFGEIAEDTMAEWEASELTSPDDIPESPKDPSPDLAGERHKQSA